MISETKRKQLEEAGYTISKSGLTVMKDGKSIGGINANGNVWSGSSKVASILKGSSEEKSKPKEKPTSKTSTPSRAPSSSSKPKARKETKASKGGPARHKPIASSKGGPARYKSEGSPELETEVVRSGGSDRRKETRGRQSILGRVAEKRKKAKEITSAGPEQGPKPSLKDFINDQKKKNPGEYRSDPSGFIEKMREMYKQKFGFNKGGMVRKGSKDYKKSGMFYKSASPRGYK